MVRVLQSRLYETFMLHMYYALLPFNRAETPPDVCSVQTLDNRREGLLQRQRP